jgi:hypothetical protein
MDIAASSGTGKDWLGWHGRPELSRTFNLRARKDTRKQQA